MIKILMFVMVILAAAFLFGGGYFFGLQSSQKGGNPTSSESSKTVVTPSASSEKEVLPTSIPASTFTPKDMKDVLKEAFESNNFESLKPNLASTVDLLLYATSCCGASRDQKEIIQFIFSSAGKGSLTWDFELKDAKYAGIKNSLKSSEILTVSSSGKAIVFTLDEEGKIKKVFSYSDYRLIGS